MNNFLLSIVILISLSACQQQHLEIFPALEDPNKVNELLTVAEMSEDIDAFIAGALQRHPNLSKYTDTKQLLADAEKLKAQLTHPLKRTDFYRIIGQLNSKLKDGHSFLLWPYQEYNALKKAGNKPFPFDVKLAGKQKLVLANNYRFENTLLEAGMQIHQINNIDSALLIEELQQYVGGETQRLREHFVANRFPIMLWAVTGAINDFELQVGDAQIKITKAQNWIAETPEESNNTQVTARQDHYYKSLNADTGYIYLGHFDINPDRFEEFVDQTFETINQQNIKNIIIDIRDNTGGNTDTVTYLARYLANKPFRLVSSIQEKINHDNRGWFGYKGEIGEVTYDEWSDWEKPIDSNNRFEGNVYLLIGPVSYSAAIVFATTLQDNQFATLIGEPTGGYANQSAQGNLFNLPHSKLRAYITTKLLVRPSAISDQAPVVPEHIINESTESITQHKDLAVDKALELIKAN